LPNKRQECNSIFLKLTSFFFGFANERGYLGNPFLFGLAIICLLQMYMSSHHLL
jgi:hypothetical protein